MASLTKSDFQSILKRLYPYKEVLHSIYEQNPFLSMVKKNTEMYGDVLKVPVKHAHTSGRSADFATAKSNKSPSKNVAFLVDHISDYSLASVDYLTMLVSSKDKGAFQKAIEFEVDSAIGSLGRSLGSKIYRDGSGSMGQVGSLSTTVLTLKDTNDVTNFEVGMRVAASDGSAGDVLQDGGAAVEITAIDYDAGTLTTTGSDWDTQLASLDADDHLYIEGDAANAGSNVCISGLEAWVPATAPTSTAFFGVDRSVNPTRLGGHRLSAGSNLRDDLIDAAVRVARQGARPDYAFMNHAEFGELVKDISGSSGDARYVMDKGLGEGIVGFETISLMTPAGAIKCVPDHNCPSNAVYMLDMSCWELGSAGPTIQLQKVGAGPAGGLREENSDSIEYRVAFYGNLICRNPGANLRLAT